ncbi:hypothetical protein BGZ61DRAFT_530106 [Ilyonectria robusta]|uniref:uncharacterized protein n=1 Tax=Ilyonectria robusta TaxID=1079257 RepID=UPI001E8D4B83|nr:uncharacterized protein BGZ61DRAFT_530106 [Ilyonectria robusta]KAH8729980.1 hypothetical protein BGZ61DRAFT_530106 [Ilyonectria robusta]
MMVNFVPLVLVMGLMSASVPAARQFVCQPGGGEVTKPDCFTAIQALLLSQKPCNGKLVITTGGVTAKHGTCCTTLYFDTTGHPGQTSVAHSIDYLGSEIAKGIARCQRGAVFFDSGAVLVHNHEQCGGGPYVGKRAGGASIPARAGSVSVEDEDDVSEFQRREAEGEEGVLIASRETSLQARAGIDLCSRRAPTGATIAVDLLDSAFKLVRTSSGSGGARTLTASFIQGVWSSMFLRFKDNQGNGNHNRLRYYYNGDTFYYIMVATSGYYWSTVGAVIGERAMDEIFHKVVSDAASTGFASITYYLVNESSGAEMVKFMIQNVD